MSEQGKDSPDGTGIMAVLEGGPGYIPAALRTLRLRSADETEIKLPHYGGYEHFEQDRHDSGAVVVYRWTGRTEIAE